MKKIILIGMILIILFSGCFAPPIKPDPIKPPPTNGENTSLNQKGLSFETAIVIEADTDEKGVAMEYDWLTENACPDQGGPKERTLQELEQKDGKWYDVLYVDCYNGEEIIYYFNIDSFFGKWE